MWRRTSRSRAVSWSSSGSASRPTGVGPGEGVEHEAREARGEDGVAGVHAGDRVEQLVGGDGLRHVAARARADGGDHVLGGVGGRQREEERVGRLLGRAADHRHAAAVGHVDVEQDDVGALRGDQRDRLLDAGRLADELDVALELGAHAGAEQPVVVDDRDARHAVPGSVSSTSVPAPGAEWIAARPPWRAMRPTIDSRTPRRSAGTAAGSKPGPRSRTKTCSASSEASA